ncbi:MAG: DUF4040 domain-containing protein [Myxococcota bacterium]|nr:DUF4040 domain-containing protein [Myxococcota bacterium]
MVPIELILFLLLLATALVVARLKDLFAAAMLTGIFSLVSAGLFTLMDAVDVAFTEAAVGAGISTILMLGTLSMTSRREDQQPFRPLPLVVVLVTGAVLVAGTLDMPSYGDPDAPAHRHEMYQGFVDQAEQDFEHIPNIVTIILASFRGYDTFGETTVIFTAAIGVLLLLGGRRRRIGDLAPSSHGDTQPTPTLPDDEDSVESGR